MSASKEKTMTTATKMKVTPSTVPPPPKFEIAHVVEALDIHVGSSTPHRYFGGDVISDQQLIQYLRGQPQINIIAFDDRAAYQRWLEKHDWQLAELRRAAAALGYELHQRGQIFVGPRGLQVHLEAKPQRPPER
jgi:hypothetical protein